MRRERSEGNASQRRTPTDAPSARPTGNSVAANALRNAPPATAMSASLWPARERGPRGRPAAQSRPQQHQQQRQRQRRRDQKRQQPQHSSKSATPGRRRLFCASWQRATRRSTKPGRQGCWERASRRDDAREFRRKLELLLLAQELPSRGSARSRIGQPKKAGRGGARFVHQGLLALAHICLWPTRI